MEEQMGLAASGAPQGQQAGMEEMVMKVAELLAQGVNPQDLLANGISEEIIKLAMQLVQSSAEPVQPPQEPLVSGLAGSMV